MGCFEQEGENEGEEGEQEEEQDVEEFIQAFIECQQLDDGDDKDGDGNNQDEGEEELWAQWCCDGNDGIELCVYKDENCITKFTGGNSYAEIMASQDSPYYDTYQSSVTILAKTVNYPLSCAAEIEYDNPNEDGEEEEQEEEGEEQDGDAAEFCQNLFGGEEGGGTLYMADCSYVNGDEQDEQQQEEDQEEDDQWADYADYYSYQVSANVAEDFQALCYEIQGLQGDAWDAEEYDESNYDVESKSTKSAGIAGLSAGAKAAIAAIVLIAVAAIGAVVYKLASSRKETDDPNEFHLVEDRKSKKGTMA